MPITYLDMGLLAVMLTSGMLAMVRGFVRESLSIVSWITAAVVAAVGYPQVLPMVRGYVGQETLAIGVAILGIFLVVLILVSLVTIKISDMILNSRISAFDRSLGFAFGLGRGLIIVVVAFLFFSWLVPVNQQPSWVREAKSLPVLDSTGKWLQSMLPDDPEAAILQRLRRPADEGGADPAPRPPAGTRSDVVPLPAPRPVATQPTTTTTASTRPQSIDDLLQRPPAR